MKSKFTSYLLFFSLFIFSLKSHSATYTWTGGVDNNWETDGNWDISGYPSASGDVVIFNSGSVDCYVNSDLALGSGSFTINGYSGSIFWTGDYTFACGAVTVTTGTLDFSGTTFLVQTTSVTVNGGNFIACAGPTFNGSGLFTISSGTADFSNTTSATISGVTISGGTFTSSSSTLTCNGNATLSGSGVFVHNNGSFVIQTKNGSTRTITGTFTFYELSLNFNATAHNESRTVNLANDITVTNNLKFNFSGGGNNKTLTLGTSSYKIDLTDNGSVGAGVSVSASGGSLSAINVNTTTNFNSSYSQTLSFPNAALKYNDIKCNNTHTNGVALGANVTTTNVIGSITVESGTLTNDPSTPRTIAGNAGKTFQVNSGATVKLYGTVGFPTGFGTNTLSSGSTFEYAGTTQTISSTPTYHNLTLSSSSGSTTKTLAAATDINGVLTTGSSTTLDAAGYTMNVGGNFINNGTFTHNNNTLIFDGTTTISGSSTNTFKHLTISGTLTAPSAATFNVTGDFTNNGTFNNNSGVVVFNGSSAQTIYGSSTSAFYDLTISNTSGVSLSSTSVSIASVLTLSNGTFAAAGNAVTLLSTATRTARIAPVTGTGACSGNFTVQRYIPSRGTITWASLAPPVTSTTFADWDSELYFDYTHSPPSNYSNVVKYSESGADYVGVTSGTTIGAGEGAEIYLSDDASFTTFSPTYLSSVGTPYTGTKMISLSYTAANAPYDGENLVGNPYASSVQVNQMSFSNCSSTIDVYDNATDNYLALSGTDEIAAHQGFWAYATLAGATITVQETDKTTTSNGALKCSESKPFMHIKIASADGSHTMAHTLKIATASDALNGFDSKDHPFRRSPNKQAPYLNVNSDKLPLVITTFNSNNEEYILPINSFVGIAGKYEISIWGLEYITKDYPCVILMDKVTGQSIDLNKVNSYTFLAGPNDNQNRFEIHFSKYENCKTPSSIAIHDNSALIQQMTNGASVTFNYSESTPTLISVSNIVGQQIIESQSIQANNQTVFVNIPNDFHGVYFVKIISTKGEVVKKFVKP